MAAHLPYDVRSEKNSSRVKLAEYDLMRALTGQTVTQCSMPETHSLTETWMFCLEFDNDYVIQLSAVPVGVGGWNERGCLKVEEKKRSALRRLVGMPFKTFLLNQFLISDCEALVYEDAEWRIDSGVLLRSSHGDEIIIATGIPTGAVSISLPADPASFKPEQSLSEYKRFKIGSRAAQIGR